MSATARTFRDTPRGHQSTSDRMRDAHAMRARGVPLRAIAEHFGVKASLVSMWCSKVEEAIADERAMARLRGGR